MTLGHAMFDMDRYLISKGIRNVYRYRKYYLNYFLDLKLTAIVHFGDTFYFNMSASFRIMLD